MVFYRKYRPQTLEDLDKKDVRDRLRALLSKPEIPHAFLFTGSKGTGKTSTARIIAKIVNCQNRRGLEPCNKCSNCISITNGSNVDVIEIDAASNRGIDEIRDLRDRIAFAPAMGGKKVYIIDEVHMLTKEAFNALLKTLEEPPPHVLFILATTELHKVPDTIVSRCTQVVFTKATTEEIKRSLKRIAEGEKLDEVNVKTLLSITVSSDGSFRDAAKLLEQYTQGAVFADTYNNAEKFLEILITQKTRDSLDFIESRVKEGVDMQDFAKQILFYLHKRLLSFYMSNVGEKNESPTNKFSAAEVRHLIHLFTHALNDMKTSYIEQLPLELAVIEWGEKKVKN